ncbi:receptor-like cytosolic serine/threonine-protein kinase RBK2 isoform X2 [Chenopodium quinoa]|uniref:receptor-like cytosolic serine/threonine-protein kinase RBK2 isoform X2 n=1 Tax=Chenopodium quinoa TaxID=63459 RepID=UPI000B77B67A|nr:receptor-like cytosolic serine/threonine-protein kinase RBK2 isoform X2 [Chenopodium quinoa]
MEHSPLPPRNSSCDPSEIAERGVFQRLRRISGLSDPFPVHVFSHSEEPLEMTEEAPADEHSLREESEEFSESDTVSTSDSEHNSGGQNSHWRGFIHMLKKGPKRFQTLHPLTLPKLTRRKSKSARHRMIPVIPALESGMCFFKPSWKNFSLKELKEATNMFSKENKIGEGGYAEVYKGVLPSGHLIAVKRLSKGDPEELAADFLSELGIIVHVNHPNIAKVNGYGVEGGMHLILDLSPNGSLESVLRGSREKLLWDIRYKIALGSAEGLQYLHEGCQRRIIHRDIKAANILLTEDFEAQISDFGLAKWLPDQWTHHTVSKFEGTFGYLPPEFFMHGIVDEKTDVYAYGVLLLELITGRLALDNTQKSLVMWAKPFLDKSNLKELIDPYLGDGYDKDQINLLATTANMCIHQFSIERPQMSEVVQILKGGSNSSELGKLTQKPSLRRSYSVELFDAEEYNSTKYLNDVGHLMQIAFDL